MIAQLSCALEELEQRADALVLCHELGPTNVDGDYPNYPLPELKDVIATNESVAGRTNSRARVIGLAVNSSQYDETEATR